MNKKRFRQLGQGMTEYVIIVALVGVAAIGVYQFFGKTVRAQMGGIASEVAGQSASDSIDNAKTAAQSAVGEGNKDKGLADYGSASNSGSGGPGGPGGPQRPE